MRLLQLNLCGSGIAACYTGRSTAAAAAVIRSETPDLVTLNEICEGDLPALEQALDEVVPDGEVVPAFQGARDRRTGDVYRCSQRIDLGGTTDHPGLLVTLARHERP